MTKSRKADTNEGVVVREVRKADLDSVAVLMKEGDDFHARLLPSHFRIVKQGRAKADLIRMISDKKVLLLVATKGKAIHGLLHARLTKTADLLFVLPKRVMTVEAVVVARGKRRTGMGKRLMGEAEKWAGKKKVDRITLNVFMKNKAAVEFYRRLGYGPVSMRMERRGTNA